jgi:hypothetical protein
VTSLPTDPVQFVRLLHAASPRDGFLELFLLDRVTEDVGSRLFITLDDPLLDRAILGRIDLAWRLRRAFFFSINLRKRESGREGDIAAAGALFVDLDGTRLPIAEQRRRLDAFAMLIAPFALVSSGTVGHVHIYFRLAAATSDLARVRAVGQRLCVYFDADNTFWTCRTAPLPGSSNWKSEPPTLVTGTIYPEATTTLDAIDTALDRLGAALPVRREQPAAPRAPAATAPATGHAQRDYMPQREPSTIRVTRVKSAARAGRVQVYGRVVGGAYLGETLCAGVESLSPAWPAMFVTAGLDPPPPGETSHVLRLWDRTVRAYLREASWNGQRRLEVASFLADADAQGATPSSTARRVP